MTKSITLVTAASKDYLKRLRWTLPTWTMKPQFRDCPLIVYVGPDITEKDVAFAKNHFKEVKIIPWDMPYDDIPLREKMLSSFVLAAGLDVQTDYYIKLDADAFCKTEQDAFEEEDFSVDLCAHKWGYTKPAWWVARMNAWVNGEDYSGGMDGGGSVGANRIISWCCLHRMSFVKRVCRAVRATSPENKPRLPIPSHDSFLWYLADHFDDCSFKAVNLKSRGVDHSSRFNSIREEICSSDCAWIPHYHANLLKHVQLEITTKCNRACPNCDRNCGTAPSDESMTVEQVKRFVDTSLNCKHKWDRIDIIGGEPTLHPQLPEMIAEIKRYKDIFQKCKIRLTSNGTGDTVKEVLSILPPWIELRNSEKEKGLETFDAVNMAPCDKGHDPARACSIPWRCGLALSRYGYFLCGAGASIARVFGMDIGIKGLQGLTVTSLREQQKALCRLCGHSKSCVEQSKAQKTSKTWEAAYDAYKSMPQSTALSLY